MCTAKPPPTSATGYKGSPKFKGCDLTQIGGVCYKNYKGRALQNFTLSLSGLQSTFDLCKGNTIQAIACLYGSCFQAGGTLTTIRLQDAWRDSPDYMLLRYTSGRSEGGNISFTAELAICYKQKYTTSQCMEYQKAWLAKFYPVGMFNKMVAEITENNGQVLTYDIRWVVGKDESYGDDELNVTITTPQVSHTFLKRENTQEFYDVWRARQGSKTVEIVLDVYKWPSFNPETKMLLNREMCASVPSYFDVNETGRPGKCRKSDICLDESLAIKCRKESIYSQDCEKYNREVDDLVDCQQLPGDTELSFSFKRVTVGTGIPIDTEVTHDLPYVENNKLLAPITVGWFIFYSILFVALKYAGVLAAFGDDDSTSEEEPPVSSSVTYALRA